MKTYEYIWLDGYQPEPQMRSKVTVEDETHWTGLLMVLPQQAEGGVSDCLLLPVQTYANPNAMTL